MENLPSRDIELLMTYEKLARALEGMHLNHEQRGERIALIAKMIRAAMRFATPEFLVWLYPLYHTLQTLYHNEYPHMTHRDIKHGLRFFAELCMAAQADMETIAKNRGWAWQARRGYDNPFGDTPAQAPDTHADYWFTVEISSDPGSPMPADGEIVEYQNFEVPPITDEDTLTLAPPEGTQPE